MSGTALLPLRGSVRRILVLRPRALGDVLLATPALRALRLGFPEAELHVGVDDTLAPLLARNPHVHRLWLLPRRRGGVRAWLGLYAGLARAHFDLVLDLHGSPRTAFLSWWTRAPNRVGYALRGRGALYNLRLPRDADRSGARRILYAARAGLEIVARCGVRGPALLDSSLVLVGDPAAEARLESALDEIAPERPRIGVAPAGSWQAKTWPLESFAHAADLLAAAGCRIVVVWGPGERALAEELQGRMRSTSALAPETTLDELGALLARLDLLVCNDSGVRHVAVARGTPTVTVFGPTSPVAWSPPREARHAVVRSPLPCLGCNFTRCSHHLCMRLLEPEAVAEKALELLSQQGAAAGNSCGS